MASLSNWIPWLWSTAPAATPTAAAVGKKSTSPVQRGSIMAIWGPMASAKSATMLLVTNMHRRRKQRVLVLAPQMSVRTDAERDDDTIVTRDGFRPLCETRYIARGTLYETCGADVDKYDVFAVDEAQFFGDLIKTARMLRARGKHVVVAGLTVDWRREPFGEMFDLLRYADQTMQMFAVCNDCCAPTATVSFNEALAADGTKKELVGGEDEGYVSLCQACYETRTAHHECVAAGNTNVDANEH